MRRITSLALSFLMILSLLCQPVYADVGEDNDVPSGENTQATDTIPQKENVEDIDVGLSQLSEEEPDPDSGTDPDNPTGSDTDPDNPSGGGTDPDNPSGGGTDPDNPSGGSTDSDNPSGGSTDSDNPSGGDTDPDNPSGGDTDPDNPSGGGTAPDNPGDGENSGDIPPDTDIPVTDIDIDDVQSPMTVGTSQMIVATVIPSDATNAAITYTSLTPEIASVNAIGRIRALAPGAARIQVSAGKISIDLNIQIVNNTEDGPVSVTAIDVDYQSNMTVGETQMLYPTALPAEANPVFTYSSSDSAIALINSFGRITAIAPGTVYITIAADGVEKRFSLTVFNELTVKEIDFGDYLMEMTIGTTQTVNVSVYPVEAVNQTVTYTSSDEAVLMVNSFGRIEAVGIGQAYIEARVGSATDRITIMVVDEIRPRDIDVDDIMEDIHVGDSFMLNATVIPTNAVDQTITYTSENPGIMTVNELGRIRAVALGTATITLRAGSVEKKVVLRVVKENAVTSIDVPDFKDKMAIDTTQTLSPSLFPMDVEDSTIYYSSSNPSVASVSRGGVITARQKGSVTITISAGAAVRRLSLKVYVPTERMQISASYLILQPGDSYTLKTAVEPVEADQNLQYRSMDSKIATVSKHGVITAVEIGRTSIIISNDDSMKSITVIVNDGKMPESEDGTEQQDNAASHQNIDALCALINEAADGEIIVVDNAQYPRISADVLITLHQTRKVLLVRGEQYQIKIKGENIKNAQNTLDTHLQMIDHERGMAFVVNDSQMLPGTVEINFTEVTDSYRYLYLYNESTEKYERLNAWEQDMATISMAGQYLLTAKKLPTAPIAIYFVLIFLVGILGAAGAYIVTKKQYWFW